MAKRQQIMIVNWRWEAFNGGVNAKIFREKNYQKHLGQIEEGKGKYFQEYPVEYSEICPEGKFVMMDIYKDDANTDLLFFALLSSYLDADSDVLLLLHRGHFYSESDIDTIREKFKKYKLKCFLIAEGRDYIYYKTQKSGLLGEDGDFYIQRDPETREYIETFDEAAQIVKQPYFDRVWMHYQYEFQNKIFELKEELFSCWFDLLLPGQPEEIPVVDLKERLQHQIGRALLFRINSFLRINNTTSSSKGLLDPEQIRMKKEEMEIERLEKIERKSFLFDDAIPNVKVEKSKELSLGARMYEETCQALRSILFSAQSHTTKFALRDLADKFNLLVQVTLGELSH